MADKFEFKVNYVRITEDGLEKFDDIKFDDLTMEDRQDIKSLVFLPIDSGVMWDVTNMIKGFPFLEHLYLPSMMTTEIKDIAKECPMLKSLVLLSHNSIVDSMDHSAVRVYCREDRGENRSEFRAFVEHQKDGRQTFFVNTEHVTNYDKVDKGVKIERLTLEKVRELVSGNDGVADMITEINFNLTDDKYAIDLSKDTLESLFEIFVEKGVSFEEFAIDFSKMCDKIESYKSLAKNVNQVSIKEDVEECIVGTYQQILKSHFNSIVKVLARRIEQLISGTTIETEKYLIADLKKNLVNALVDHPSFDDNYASGNTLETILMDMSTAIAPYIKSSKIRGLARKYIAEVVSEFKNNKAELVEMIGARLKARANVDVIFDIFAEGLGLELKKKSQTKLASDIVDVLSVKNLGTITKEDIKGILEALKKKMGNEELRSKEIVAMLTDVVADYPTIEEINDVLVSFIEKNGYSAIKLN